MCFNNFVQDCSTSKVVLNTWSVKMTLCERFLLMSCQITMGGQKKVAPSNYNTGIGIYDV